MNNEVNDRHTLLFKKIENDLSVNNVPKAISRLEGAMQNNPLDAALSNKLGELYFQQGNFAKAGKCWYLFGALSEQHQKAISAFRRSLSNDPILMLQQLISRSFSRFAALNDAQLEKLGQLLSSAKSKAGTTPKFLQPLENHITKRTGNYLPPSTPRFATH